MYRRRTDAVRDARAALWGDVDMRTQPSNPLGLRPSELTDTDRVVVTADVNGVDYAITFDNWGHLLSIRTAWTPVKV
jgi:hypothetical protein